MNNSKFYTLQKQKFFLFSTATSRISESGNSTPSNYRKNLKEFFGLFNEIVA